MANTPQNDPAAFLSAVPLQARLRWPEGVPKSFIDTARRFTDITARDWMLVFFDEALHLARVSSGLASDADHPLNRPLNRDDGQESFKFRRITSKKSFPLSRLPDSYRLVPSAGRGNVHQFNDEATRSLVKILADSADADAAVQAIRTLPAMKWLDLLGPAGWESFCLGFLILKERFLPTGLAVGRTLRTLDIAGRDGTGKRLLASCKKNPYAIVVPPEFVEICRNFDPNGRFFLFAYGGCVDAPEWMRVVTRTEVEAWVRTEDGGRYLDMWRQ